MCVGLNPCVPVHCCLSGNRLFSYPSGGNTIFVLLPLIFVCLLVSRWCSLCSILASYLTGSHDNCSGVMHLTFSPASPTSPQIDKFSLHSSPGAEVGAAVASSHHQGNSDCRHENGCPSHAEGGALNADLFPSLHTPVLGSGSGAGGGAGGGGRGSRRGGGCGNFNREEQSDMDLALALMAERQTEDERVS